MQNPAKGIVITLILLGVIIATFFANSISSHSVFNIPAPSLIPIIRTAALFGLFSQLFSIRNEESFFLESSIAAYKASFLVAQSILVGIALSGSLSHNFTIAPADAYLVSAIALSVYLLKFFWAAVSEKKNAANK